MNRDLLRQIVTALLVIALIVLNLLSNILPYNNLNTGQISDSFDVLFVPAGYVFSIWGVIYLGLIAYAVFQALPAQRENPRLRRIFPAFVVGAFANVIWLFLWHYLQFAWTLPVMLILLGSLIVTYLGLGVQKARVSTLERWLVHVPFSIYLGWITVATVANISDVLWFYKWNQFGLGAETWMAIILAAVVGIAAAMNFLRRDVAYALVLLWALAGITVRQSGNAFVVTATWIAFALVALTLIVAYLLPRPALPARELAKPAGAAKKPARPARKTAPRRSTSRRR